VANASDTPFPSSDHLPLGRTAAPILGDEGRSTARPFGLGLAVRARDVVTVDRGGFEYDVHRQIGWIQDGDGRVPLSKHTDGKTNTVTDGGDGQNTNKDSDTDQRED
jgi:putative ATP-grasp target RiPP